MFVDTHTHLNFEAFKNDWKAIADESVRAGVEKMIVVGTDLKTSRKAVEMAKNHEALFASVGIHPHHARRWRKITNYELRITKTIKKLTDLAKDKKVVAIGEVGLDYYVYTNTRYKIQDTKDEWIKIKNLQKRLLGMQIDLAKKLGKPMIIHSRNAKDEILDALEHFSKSDGKLPKGVFHCFEGSKKYLKKVLEAGFYAGFTGHAIRHADRAEAAKMTPLNRLLLETDCPYIKVRPDSLRSTPLDVKIIAQVHAKRRGINLFEVEKETTENVKRLFGI